MILQVNHKLTLQEFLNLSPGEGDITYELVDGQAISKMSPSASSASSASSARLNRQILKSYP